MTHDKYQFENHILKTLGLEGRIIRKLTLTIGFEDAPLAVIEEYVGFDMDVETKVFKFTEESSDEETQTPQR